MNSTSIFWFIIKTIIFAGVVLLTSKFFNTYINHKAIERRRKKLSEELQIFNQSTEQKLIGYEHEISRLSEKFLNYQSNVEALLESNDNILNQMFLYADKIVSLNDEFLYKVDLIDKALSNKSLSDEDCKELITEMRRDIEVQKQLIEEQKEVRLQKQKENEIERSPEKGRHHG